MDEALFLATVVPAPTRWRWRFEKDGALRASQRAQMHFIGRAMAVAFWSEVCLLATQSAWAADAWGKTRVMVPGFAAMLVGTLLVPWTTGPVSYGVAFVIVTAGMSVWMTVPALMAEHFAGSFGGKAAGLYRSVTDFGFIVGPAAVGWLAGRFGFAAGALAIAGVLVVSILLSTYFLPRRV